MQALKIEEILDTQPVRKEWQPDISSLIQAAQTATLQLERQLGQAHDKDNSQDLNTLWEDIAKSLSDDWLASKQRLDEAKTAFETKMAPENKPLGKIGMTLDSAEMNDLEDAYNEALIEFNAVDQTLRKCNIAATEFEKVSAPIRARQKKEAYLNELRTALGVLQKSEILSEIANEEPFEFPEFDLGPEHIHTCERRLEHLTKSVRIVSKYVNDVQKIRSSGVITARWLWDKITSLFVRRPA